MPPPSDEALNRPSLVTGGGSSLVVEDVEWQRIFRSPGFLPGLAVFAAIVILFWSLMVELPRLYLEGDGYYSHGLMTPFLAGYLIYRKWDVLKTIPIRGSWFALIPMLAVLFVVRVSSVIGMQTIMSLALVAVLILGVWLIAGLRWAITVLPALLYLLFGLPIWSMAINVYTNPLQIASTDVAVGLLQGIGMKPFVENGTEIHLNTYTLSVGVPCSGLKLIVALSAFTAFFVMMGGLKFWGNVILVLLLVPLCLFINGLRIALIGVVGEYYGTDAAASFHDWSGYLTLIVCFLILMRIWRLLGWQR